MAGPATVVLAENARPGETLWPVKLWIERVRLVLERDAEKDVALRLEFASRRVGDLQYVAAQQSPLSLVAEVTENLCEHIEAAMPTFRELAEEDSDGSALGSQMELVLRQSIQVLQGLVATACQGGGDRPAPAEAACSGLQRALANSTAAMERIHELPGAGGGQRGGGVEEPPGKGDGNGSRGKGSDREQPGHGQGNRGEDKQPPEKGQDEQPPGKGKDKEPPGQGKEKEPPGQGKDKEPPGRGKDKEPPGQGKDAQPPEEGKATDQSGKGKGAGL